MSVFPFYVIQILMFGGYFYVASSQNLDDFRIYVATELGLEPIEDIQGVRITIPYGQTITITCVAPEPVTWHKSGGTEVTKANLNSNLGIFQFSDENAHLKINGFRKSYRGMYTCLGMGANRAKHVILENSPPIDMEVDILGAHKKVSVGDAVTIQAISYGFNPMETDVNYIWLYNGREVDESDSNIIMSSMYDFVHTLTLLKVRETDFGSYTFQISRGINTVGDRIHIMRSMVEVVTTPITTPITTSMTTLITTSMVTTAPPSTTEETAITTNSVKRYLPILDLTFDLKPYSFRVKKGRSFNPCIILLRGLIPPGRVVQLTPEYSAPNVIQAFGNIELTHQSSKACIRFQVIRDDFIDKNRTYYITFEGESVSLVFITSSIKVTIVKTNGAKLKIVGPTTLTVIEGKKNTTKAVPICIGLVNVGAGLRRDVLVKYTVEGNETEKGSEYSAMEGTLVFKSGSKHGATQCTQSTIIGDNTMEEKNTSFVTIFSPMEPDRFLNEDRNFVRTIIIDDDLEVFCSTLDKLLHGNILFSNNSNSSGSIATHKCDRNYRLQGSQQLICQRNGTWSSSQPKCVSGSRTFSFNWILIILVLLILTF